jgi:hypothetical protein
MIWNKKHVFFNRFLRSSISNLLPVKSKWPQLVKFEIGWDSLNIASQWEIQITDHLVHSQAQSGNTKNNPVVSRKKQVHVYLKYILKWTVDSMDRTFRDDPILGEL